jgi:hypothetical protein
MCQFSRTQRFFSQVSNTNNALNVLFTPHVSSIVMHFGFIYLLFTLPIHFEKWQPLVHLF